MKMAASVEGAGFWLPSEFLTDDDFLMDKENFNKSSNSTEPDSEFCFPTEFPYDFETQTDQLLEVRNILLLLSSIFLGFLYSFLKLLFSRFLFLQKFWVMSSSPQSTLAHLGSAGGSSNGSPNGVTSPPTTPLGAKYDAVGDLIYLAAGQVAKLKLNRGFVMGPGPTKGKGLLVPSRSLAQFYPEGKTPSHPVYLNTHVKPFFRKYFLFSCNSF